MREERFTTLYHYVTDEDHLGACYADLSADRAPGEDGVGKEEYGANLESKLKELRERLGGMGYRPQPSEEGLYTETGHDQAETARHAVL
ncbi:hypothetical protein BH20ACI3_BH20ACI3_09800 [soil metagenome]